MACLEDTVRLINAVPGGLVQFPTSKKAILNLFTKNRRDCIRIIYYAKCKHCSKYTENVHEKCKQSNCVWCNRELKCGETNFFVFLPVEDQLKQCIKRNWKKILETMDVVKDGNHSTDVHDGTILRNLYQKYENTDLNVLSLMLNTDGANKFKSNKKSIWPIQIIQNFLPPEIRFNRENIIVAGLWYGAKKPDCLAYFLPLIKELKSFKTNELTVNIGDDSYKFLPLVTHGIVDLPAKSMLQQISLYSGYQACTYCHHTGELVRNNKTRSKTVRYTATTKPPDLRNHAETIKIMHNIATSNKTLNDNKGIKGIKIFVNFLRVLNKIVDFFCNTGVSCLVSLPEFDIILGFGIDYMHAVLLGTMKKLFGIWFNPANRKELFHITKSGKRMLSQRLLAVKPISDISRMPRSLDELPDFKASEFRSLLFYYLPICLKGIFKHSKYYNHFMLFSSSIYTLNKTSISDEELKSADDNLQKFVKEYQELYGANRMTMNVHLLTHLAMCVRNLGPLWTHSAFSCESTNGFLLNMVNGTKDVIQQIASKYRLFNIFKLIEHGENKEKRLQITFLGKPKKIKEEITVTNLHTQKVYNTGDGEYSVYKRIRFGTNVYTSLLYTRPQKTCDSFIGLTNNMIGQAKYFFSFDNNQYVLLKVFEVQRKLHQFLEVLPTNSFVMDLVSNISKKFVHMKFCTTHFIVSSPNMFEKD